jgi:hypothetical protein
MSTMSRLKPVLLPGIGWQLWTPAALPFLASCGEVNAHPASGMTSVQRALIAESLCCLPAQLPFRAPRQTDRAGETSTGSPAAPTEPLDRLQRAVDALASGGVWLWWRQRDRMPQLDLLFLRVDC